MNPLLALLDSTFASRLGWTLLHFLWQGAVIALVAALVLAALRRASASARHGVACLALAAMAIAPAVTFVQLGAHNLSEPRINWTADNAGQLSRLPSATDGAVGEMTAASKRTGGTPVLRWLLPWLTVGWATGVLVSAVRLAGGWWQTQRLRSRGANPLGELWPARLTALQQRLGVRRPVRLCESALARSPMVIGWLRPVILLPMGLASGLPLAQVEAIIAHELAHLRRHDHLVNLAQRLIETVLFYHPAVWWVSARIREERELCCDDLAATALGDGATLAHALVSLAERQAALPEFAFAADGGPLGARVRRLLGVPDPETAMTRPALVVVLLLVVGLGAGGVWFAQREAGRKPVADIGPVAQSATGLSVLSEEFAKVDAELAHKREELDELRLKLRLRAFP